LAIGSQAAARLSAEVAEIDRMSGPQPAPTADDDGPGILGNLPRTRPSVRSPRRADAVAPDPEAAATGSPTGGEPAQRPRAASREQELEDLARAGLSLAGGAATLGLRAAGRAAAALRGAVERK
jgi:hypothetical protein